MSTKEQFAKLLELCSELKRGCDCIYDDRCGRCETIIEVRAEAERLRSQAAAPRSPADIPCGLREDPAIHPNMWLVHEAAAPPADDYPGIESCVWGPDKCTITFTEPVTDYKGPIPTNNIPPAVELVTECDHVQTLKAAETISDSDDVTLEISPVRWRELLDDLESDAAELARLREVEKAASALIADVRRRYQGEELRCPFMQNLNHKLTGGTDGT